MYFNVTVSPNVHFTSCDSLVMLAYGHLETFTSKRRASTVIYKTFLSKCPVLSWATGKVTQTSFLQECFHFPFVKPCSPVIEMLGVTRLALKLACNFLDEWLDTKTASAAVKKCPLEKHSFNRKVARTKINICVEK